jgi:putative glutamine amidotransferase
MARSQGSKMVRSRRRKGKPIIGITCEVHKLKPFFSQFELVCDYRYTRSVIRGGGIPVLIPINHEMRSVRTLLKSLNGLVFIGGADIQPHFYGEYDRHKIDPMYRGRTRFDMKLFQMARKQNLPILMICYGAQLLNVIHGGTLYQDIKKQIRKARNHRSKKNPFHFVYLEKGSKISKILRKRSVLVHSEHHQAVKHTGYSLRVVGRSADGIVEALEGPPDTIAVQWHPERQEKDPTQRRLFRYFVGQCQKNR